MLIYSENKLRERIVEICRKLYEKGFIAGSDGNISVKLGEQYLLTTPTSVHKGALSPEQIVKTDLEGNSLEFNKKPSSEFRMHVLIYKLRKDVRAVIHAHPPFSVALSLVSMNPTGCVLPEAVLTLGYVPITKYATPTTEEVPEVIKEHILTSNGIILARHGTVTVGSSLDEAYLRLEILEHSSRIIAIAKSIGNITPLNEEELKRLERRARELGISPPAGSCIKCNICKTIV